MPPKRKRVAQAPARYRATPVGPPSKRARTVEGPEDGPVVLPVDPVDPPSVTDVLQQQMHLMQAQLSSIQEVVMGMAASSQSVPLAPPEATSPLHPPSQCR